MDTRHYCRTCLCYHTDEQGCPNSKPQVLPKFEGTDADYQIATRSQHIGGSLDDAMDGTLLVRHEMAEYQVVYLMGVPVRVRLFANPPAWID